MLGYHFPIHAMDLGIDVLNQRVFVDLFPKAPCRCIVYTWALKGLPCHSLNAYVYTRKLQGAFGIGVGFRFRVRVSPRRYHPLLQACTLVFFLFGGSTRNRVSQNQGPKYRPHVVIGVFSIRTSTKRTLTSWNQPNSSYDPIHSKPALYQPQTSLNCRALQFWNPYHVQAFLFLKVYALAPNVPRALRAFRRTQVLQPGQRCKAPGMLTEFLEP